MPKRLFLFVFILFSFCARTTAQGLDSTLGIYAENFSPEKLHLHIDRSVYSKGETIYYKAYLLADHGLSDLSKNLYVDFYEEGGKLLQQTTAPLLQSSAKGSFTIPVTYAGKSIEIKAYTKWMFNFDTAFIYRRHLRIYNANGTQSPGNNEKADDSTLLSLFPEGGFAIEGLNNRFAFAATDRFGNPINIKGVLKSSDGKKSDSIASLHDGMGSFLLFLQKGLSYSFEWQGENGRTGTTPIVAGKKSGAGLRIIPQTNKATVSIQRTVDAGESFKTMHLLVHKNFALRYKLDINMSEKTFINLDINTADFPSGIVQFTLFNDDWVPVAERILFVNNRNYFFQAELNVTKKDTGKKGKNELEVFVADTLFSNLSLAVIDAGLINDIEEPSVFSDFLLTDEIKGKLHNPGYYFSQVANSDSLQAAHLDLVMLTHGHRRYDWQRIVKGAAPDIKYPAEINYLGLKGKLTNKKLNRSADKLLLNVMLQGKDSAKTVFIIPGEAGGIFEKKNVFYYDSVKLFYNINDKRSVAGQNVFQFENGLLSSNERNKFFAYQLTSKTNRDRRIVTKAVIPETDSLPLLDEQEKLRNEIRFKELREVVVRSRVKTKMQILDEYYTRGVFAGDGNNYKVDIEGDVTVRGYSSIFHYLQAKIPGLSVSGTYPNISVTWFKNFSFYDDPSGPTFFLDEMPVSLEAINTVPIADIAYVKAFRPPFVGSFLGGVNGTIVIYTKKGISPVYEDTSGIRLAKTILEGYTKFKEFTQPDYETTKTTDSDYRATLYWNPYLVTDKSLQRVNVNFYNNDISKKFLVVLEGINLEGKMVRVVKLIE